MPKTYSPVKVRPKNVNRFRGTTSILTQAAVTDALTVTQHNLVSNEIRQTTQREGFRRNTSAIEDGIFNGSVYARHFGEEISALSEGTRVWSELLYPTALRPIGDISWTPVVPNFNPPSWEPPGDLCCYGVDIPDPPTFDWPGIPPIVDIPLEEPPDIPLPPDPDDDPPDAPYGPDIPPFFEDPPTDNPCGWSIELQATDFNLAVTVDNWRIVVDRNTGPIENASVCLKNYCSPGTLNCANHVAAEVSAMDAAHNVVLGGQTGFAEGVQVAGENGACATISWGTFTEQDDDFGETDTVVMACIMPAAEFPTGNVLPRQTFTWHKTFRSYRVLVDVTISNFGPLMRSTFGCQIPKVRLVWDNGYAKEVPLTDSLNSSYSGTDLVVKDLDLGIAAELTTNTGGDECAVDGAASKVRCTREVIVWECGGVPPPKQDWPRLVSS